ncbi:unnamed protein product [Protopolystoma xenopodis]|uniref:Uncharacterized protein n=1 Tax=Protopolystoma xenopodis TaxID=117903 RepID=A0A448X9G5_9PLAT|nr:unnamed protein product [Protopolystoma xenopodis]
MEGRPDEEHYTHAARLSKRLVEERDRLNISNLGPSSGQQASSETSWDCLLQQGMSSRDGSSRGSRSSADKAAARKSRQSSTGQTERSTRNS